MAFEDSSQARGGSRAVGTGLSTGDYLLTRRATPTYEVMHASTLTATGDGEPTTNVDRLPVPDLHYVFDDPSVGEPGRDRMIVHGVWELVLAVALAIAGYFLAQAQPGALGGDGLRRLAIAATVFGLVAAASSLALRAGVPNLAVGGVAVTGTLYFAHHADGSWTPAVAAVGICALIGLVQGLVVAGLHVPAWAASLAVALALFVWSGDSRRSSSSAATNQYATRTSGSPPSASSALGRVCSASCRRSAEASASSGP